MKKHAFFLILLFAAMLPFSASAAGKESPDDPVMRGMWLSYGNFKAAGLYNKSEAEFRENADAVFRNLDKYGFNAIFFHVRPFDDAIYPGSGFKWCESLSKKPLDYDALEILVSAAHEHGIAFHAWINPYRITASRIYDPADPATTERIISGIMEIIENYDVDGIHFDDYFYPSAKRGNQFYRVSEDERKENVNFMVSSVYKEIKDYDPDILFGISPAGNIEYAESIGCDLDTWLTEDGYVDYIAPQIYWSDSYLMKGKVRTLFTDRFEKWSDLGLGNIPVYPGLALYRAGMRSSVDRGWQRSSDNLAKQVKLCDFYDCNGYLMFDYGSLLAASSKKEMASYMKYLSSLSLDNSSIRIKKGGRRDLSELVYVKDKYAPYIKYSSSSESIAAVTENGIIRARKKGVARIYVKGIAGSKTSCLVRVY